MKTTNLFPAAALAGVVACAMTNAAWPQTPGTPEEFSTFLKAEIGKWSKVIKQAGITAE